MRRLIMLLTFLITLGCHAQEKDKFNLGFEIQNERTGLPFGWIKWGNYMLIADSIAHSGKKSGKIISSPSGGAFGSIAFAIPAKYDGKTIRLEGYMKIKNVEGYAGLLLRIDGNGRTLAFDNMQTQNISGTKDWQKYSITLNYPEQAENILVAGLLAGKGEAWFDDFVVTIDGENVQTLKEIKKEPSIAQLDNEFDNGSFVNLSTISSKSINNLELLGRIWGFLKYHHPAINGKTLNWDYELFRFIPKYLKAADDQERDKLIINWINILGKLENCLKCNPTNENAILKPDLKWIENQDESLREKLLFVYNNRSQTEHYYIGTAPSIGNPIFKNENSYSKMPYPDDGYRLLSLYRYWNAINYFFPYKHLMDKDWNLALKEYIPIFINAKDELEYELAALRLIGEVKDTHANLWGGGDKIDAWKGSNYSPIHVRFIEDKLVVTDYYNPEMKESVGLELGDIITRINGSTVEGIVREKSKYYPASNIPTQLRDISGDLLRSNSREIRIDYISEGSKEQSKVIRLYPKDSLNIYRWFKKYDGRSFKTLDNNIGYITLESIKAEDIYPIKEELKDTRGIIIDIRNYPSTFVPFSLGSYFVSSTTPFVKFTTPNPDNPGEFTFTKSLEIPGQGKKYSGKLVVLVNEFTQSQAEYTAMAFRSGNNTTIIGSTTAGADGNVSSIPLPGGLSTMISGIGVYYPNGRETQRVGIIPDIQVRPTIEGIRIGKDELFEKAIELIMKK